MSTPGLEGEWEAYQGLFELRINTQPHEMCILTRAFKNGMFKIGTSIG